MSIYKNKVLFLREEYGDGQGTFFYSDGSKYVGEWKNGKKHGKGTLTHLDGEKYVGGWKDDKYYGKGILFFPDGEKYEGKIQGR